MRAEDSVLGLDDYASRVDDYAKSKLRMFSGEISADLKLLCLCFMVRLFSHGAQFTQYTFQDDEMAVLHA